MTDASDVEPIVERIRPLLAGHPPMVQGAVLADLLAIWIAGHIVVGKPTRTAEIREAFLERHLELVRELIPVNEALFIRKDGS